MTDSTPQVASLIVAEDGLIDHIRQHAELSEAAYRTPEDWRYRSQFHLLLALGRRFTATHSPDGLIGMPDRLCYSNAARYALAHGDEGLVYAEGFALTHSESAFYLPHVWIVRPDGTMLDPTSSAARHWGQGGSRCPGGPPRGRRATRHRDSP
ncbi:hypothetical protein OHA74_52975 [Streptomyces phaeochromogenes]|uniref:hypothetical protein n=1 Tax=Streptomyces phaeochromogenes TaxID=1923 RepID=UPI002E2BDE00|nr:hypothetical protein [Streptomyces phaeochromogenes]